MGLKAQPPAVPSGLVRRRRLEELLTGGASRPFTLVSAGPGAGKTLAVAAWIAFGAAPWPVAWLSLDHSDNDPRTFWADLLGALATSPAVPADSALRDIIPAAGFGADEALEVRARLAELPGPVILVLDDFHEITGAAVHEGFGQLVDHLPPQLRLVMLTRSDPILRLHRLRVNGHLSEVRTSDLAFTQDETAELFDLQGIHLQPEQVGILRSRTEGWSAGLRLAAMSLDPRDIDRGIARFSGNDRSIADYLVGEVIERLPPEDRAFLLDTSVADRLSGDLADALTGRPDSQRMLEKLAGANAFVVALGESNEWFSYHPLLRELLRHRLSLEQPRTVADLHRRAAIWMATQGEPIESIRHWIQAGDIDGAGRLLLTALPRILSPDGPALAAAIEPLAASATDVPTLPALLASAAYHLHRHEYTSMDRDTREAREFLDEAPDDVRVSAEVVINLFEMGVARMNGDIDALVAAAAGAIDLLDRTPRRAVPASRHYRVIATANLGGAQLWSGAFDDAERNLASADPESLELGLPLVNINAAGHRALLEALQGRNRLAERRARQTTQIIDRRGWSSEPQSLAAYLAMGLVELSRGHVDAAGAQVDHGLSASGRQTDRSLRLALAIAAVQVAVLRRDPAAAFLADARLRAGLTRTPKANELLVRWGAVAGAEALLLADRPAEALERIGRPGGGGFAAAWERCCLARARFATGQQRAAEVLIEPLLEPGYSYREPAIQAWLVQAVMSDRNHRETAALAAVSAAVDLAQPEHIRRPFMVTGGLVALLHRYRQLGGKHAGFAADLVETITPTEQGRGGGSLMVEHLTERELIVLHYLPTMLKAGEIAADLFVSVNTVKAHLRSMYRKLGVSNRREAVERARALGLL